MGTENVAFADIHPDDGYSVVEVNMEPMEISLHLTLRSQGEEIRDSLEVWSEKCTDEFAKGRQARVRLVLEAIARYFNTGGCWSELQSLVASAYMFIQDGLNFAGWNYFSDYTDLDDGSPIDVFLDDQKMNVTVWDHGNYVETVSVDAYVRSLEEDQSEDGDENDGQEPAPESEDRAVRGDEDARSADNSHTADCGARETLALPGPAAQGTDVS